MKKMIFHIKQIKTVIAACFCLMVFAGCNLDLVPQNTLMISNAFKSEKELNANTTSIHVYISKYMAEDLAFLYAGEVMDYTTTNEGIRSWNPYQIPSIPTNDWRSTYDIIYLSHMLLDNIHRVPGLSEASRNYHMGQAEFALGLSYLSLAQRFGDAVITKDSEEREAYNISDKSLVIEEAIKHAKNAYDLLPKKEELKGLNNEPLKSKQFASKGTAATLLANIYAWKGSMIKFYGMQGDASEAYSMAVKFATEVISGNTGHYALCASAEELVTNISTRSLDNPEEIFSFIYDKEGNADSRSRCPGMYYVNWPVDKTRTMGDIVTRDIQVYMSTVKKIFPDPKDARLKAFFYEAEKKHIVDGVDYAFVYKWRDAIHEQAEWSDSGVEFLSLNANYVYWRLADLILLRAEALAQQGKDAEAIKDINLIRQRAGSTPYPNGKDDAKTDLCKAVFKERERELIFEGHRYFDVVRNGYYNTELQGKFNTLTKAEVANGALYLPVPQGAFKTKDDRVINPYIRQNKYWSQYVK